MKFSHNWLQQYFDEKIPEPNELAELLNTYSFEVESVEIKENDTLLDIDVLPNRAHDCLSHYGMAKEVSVLTGLNIKDFQHSNSVAEIPNNRVAVEVKDKKLCRRYIAVEMQNIKVKDSPDWLKERLESIGQKSINNIVDATNYVMFSIGQPLHAFDKDKLDGNEIIIRNANNGEKILTLDNKDVVLNEENLVIADSKSVLAIAGVKGGKKAEVDENTANLILESANFNPTSIRKTSRGLGILTDSSKRFENEITPELVEEGMNKLISIIKKIAGGEVVGKEDIYPRKPNQYKVGFTMEDVNNLLGLKISKKEIENILNRLGFEFAGVRPLQKVLELAPTLEGVPYKLGASVVYDAPNFFDCSSFTAYIFAQAGIAIPRISVDQFIFGKEISKDELKTGDLVFSNTGEGKINYESIEFLSGTKIEKGIDHVGLYLGDGKIIHTSRYNEKGTQISDLESTKQFENIVGFRRIFEGDKNCFVVSIPFERLDLRIKQDLIEEIGRIYGYRNIKSVLPKKVFESKMNKVFYYTNKVRKILTDLGFSEVYTYTFGDKGNVEVQKPLASNLTHLRINLGKNMIDRLEFNRRNSQLLGLSEIKLFEIGKVFPTIDGEYISLCIGKTDGILNEVINGLAEEGIFLNESGDTDLIEVNLTEIIEKLHEPKSYEDVLENDNKDFKFQKISLYPFMLRDIAVWVPNTENEESVLSLIKENAGELLVHTKLFDTYSPEGENKTSYAFNLVFQSQEKTLTDDEINQVMDNIYMQIQKNSWEVR